ncbi:hypothetical protein [Blastococcus sp. TF02A-26]|uniref:hypothetical protein n=1 Tax=Blastococcus sp. TF02A-26 TaxID=2250577 RepID=UPI0011BFB546|nr:hypothetical protein [Blastococcus sp. TF02A-26]
MTNDEPDEASKRAIDAGVELLGSVSGALVGGLVGGPPGAIGGAVAGPVLTSTLKEVARRILSKGERRRVGAAFGSAVLAVEELRRAGLTVRQDGFFEPATDRRAKAEEVVEGVLLAAQREHEKFKVIHYGYLVANVAFDSGIDLHTANWCLRTGQDLTWTQLVLLRIIGDVELTLTLAGEIGRHRPEWSAWTLHEQLSDLGFGRRGLIGAPNKTTPITGLPYPSGDLSAHRLTNGGILLLKLMWLDRIPQSEVSAVLAGIAAESEISA